MTDILTRLPIDGGFDIDELAGIVPMASTQEQEVLTGSIKETGQHEPITLWNRRVVDGRCRQLALMLLAKPIMYRELSGDLTRDEVKVYVKAVNTRRNLTATQKIMTAAKESLEDTNTFTVKKIAEGWGVSKRIVENGRYLFRNYKKIAEELFNGENISIEDARGIKMQSNKVTAVYAYLRRMEESAAGIEEDTAHGWDEGSFIKTQKGKEWYYAQIREAEVAGSVRYKMLVAELANYKFADNKPKVDNVQA